MDPTQIVKVAATAGLISTTAFWSMNLTISHLAFPALLLGSIPALSSPSSPNFYVPSTATPQSPPPFLTRQWQEVYWRGVRAGPVSAIISTVAYVTAAWFSGPGTRERYLYAVAAGAAGAVMPWTVLVLVPVNDELHRRGDKLGKDAGKDAVKGDGRDVVGLIRAWVRYNDVRAALGLVGTVVGVVAFFQ